MNQNSKFSKRLVHGDWGRDYSANEIGLGEVFAVDKHQRRVEKVVFQIIECLEQMPSGVMDRFFLFAQFSLLL